jgi:hypothetical protein
MSALGQKQTFGPFIAMSALPPKADIAGRQLHVRFVPILLQKAAITDTSSLKRGFELVTCRQLILAVLNYAGLREAGLCGGRWSDDKLGKPAEILCDRRQRELELSASRPTQSQTTEPQDAFEMREQHFNALSVMA